MALASAQRALPDASLNLGIESCRDCHEAAVGTWERTRHAMSMERVLASPLTATLAKGMKLRPDAVIREASCVRCHFTQESLASSVQITAGVSCESCHGGARDWIDEHNRKSLTRTERVRVACDRGMLHPQSLVEVANGCFECHVVDDEVLVNRGGHPALSKGFELCSWYAGEVKHEFLVQEPGHSVKSHTDEPQSIPMERKRLMYVSGKMLHLGHTLRAISLSSDAPVDKNGKPIRLANGEYTFGVQHAVVAQSLIRDLEKIQSRVPIPELSDALGLALALTFATGEQQAMADASREILRLAGEMEKGVGKYNLESIDSLISAVGE